MQTTLAILAPTLTDVTPLQRSRAERAALEQMMLLARGLPIDSPAVRCAAELVGSAITPDPVEFELAPMAEHEDPAAGWMMHAADGMATRRVGGVSKLRSGSRVEDWGGESRRSKPAEADVTPDAAWKLCEGYSRYLRTIMSTQPV